ncbi:MAG: D-tyrosyl-tRNA(Tyr) deacylase [Candidatus Dactylopiibacterium carminicum]|uniref:D-aminoacyl-tRNA deacylase n=1 Tax=Candidatus Dactylopiibacterium carminicum TaxID=857335 RepID=A0A272EU93_9RHOO|nr:D-aminoacyl-tRNA deacylase [Candidatus Dactylopiibacterium carminicum]KAF7599732.1 D-tyrosyl-tRNA(Tyr) deacylase [Candidatus Dactylopiibacterium carminicum]PAS93668.1 MAG: D-tyrosyl-tRNA(Tyr) deacylase [Candidatus Dactylopiibacterium carminicum]PAS97536.1 MAG: D-tyrosyl-tRNA(Tyr) deacylase [Candidatus Dactylopiibacterium carminicum]PAS99734.1 MAG: D-tyrosyl-tRNA(Tyr) deacylase [Candidatus Dactylopiibacterium carminicum]
MIALIQRVRHASVSVEGREVGAIDAGLLALVGIQREDDQQAGQRLLDKLLAFRVFSDERGRMNRSLADTGGGLLLVSQFTLAADTRSGTRPSFTPAAPPDLARTLFDSFVESARSRHGKVACGEFGADMQVSLLNDGPVTFWLET